MSESTFSAETGALSATYPLETKNESITRAFVFVHGILRDADNHFRTALAAAFLADALNDTIIVAPRFASNSSAPVTKLVVVLILLPGTKRIGAVTTNDPTLGARGAQK